MADDGMGAEVTRRIVIATFLAAILVGCLPDGPVRCADGTLCSAGTVCRTGVGCASDEQAEACDGVCSPLEDCALCPGDCGACVDVCTDLVCDASETVASCPSDCVP